MNSVEIVAHAMCLTNTVLALYRPLNEISQQSEHNLHGHVWMTLQLDTDSAEKDLTGHTHELMPELCCVSRPQEPLKHPDSTHAPSLVWATTSSIPPRGEERHPKPQRKHHSTFQNRENWHACISLSRVNRQMNDEWNLILLMIHTVKMHQ